MLIGAVAPLLRSLYFTYAHDPLASPGPTASAPTSETSQQQFDRYSIRTPEVPLVCNFSDSDVIGFPPFPWKKNHSLCSLHISERTAGFMYFCDGMSRPAGCPRTVKHMYGERDLASFFDESLMESKDVEGSHTKAWIAYLTRPIEDFEGLCICYRADGRTMTLRLSAGNNNLSYIGVLAILIVTIIQSIA